MSRLLIIGSSPLLFEEADRTYAAGARTWQLTRPLIAEGHRILLIGQRLPKSYPPGLPAEVVVREEPDFTYKSVCPGLFHQEGYLQNLADSFQPDAVIYPHGSASFNSKLFTPAAPTWIDINGHLMTEAQAKSALEDDDSYLDHFFRIELDMLIHGDVISTVCDPQTWAVVGELGLIGRLNSRNSGQILVESVPVGVSENEYVPTGRAYRGLDVPPDAFVVLWSGGYNTWTDIDTMFEGLEYAMKRVPNLHFVSTGGQIDGHDEETYPRMVSLVNVSLFRDRYHLRGWISRSEVPNYYLEADLGINCEKNILEVALGSKQRILDWSRASLACVTSRLTELSTVIEREKIGFVFAPGDARELGRQLVTAAHDRSATAELGTRCRERLRELYAYEKTIEPFKEWARTPWKAPDRDRDSHCLEKVISDGAATKAGYGQALARLADAESRMAAGIPAAPEAAPEDESRLAWLLRVTHESVRQGGISLVFKRFLIRLTGRSATIDTED